MFLGFIVNNNIYIFKSVNWYIMRTSDLLKALADETRLDIISLLMSGRKNVGQIVTKIKKSQPNTSLALRQLLITGIIEQEKQGREVYYNIRKPEQLRTLLELLEQLQK
jgi:DNA-binding transcriptional ArsR family regulator